MRSRDAQRNTGERPKSAHEVKNNCSLFERLFKVKKSGVFLYGISSFVLEILAFLYYANEESDDIIGIVVFSEQFLALYQF